MISVHLSLLFPWQPQMLQQEMQRMQGNPELMQQMMQVCLNSSSILSELHSGMEWSPDLTLQMSLAAQSGQLAQNPDLMRQMMQVPTTSCADRCTTDTLAG